MYGNPSKNKGAVRFSIQPIELRQSILMGPKIAKKLTIPSAKGPSNDWALQRVIHGQLDDGT